MRGKLVNWELGTGNWNCDIAQFHPPKLWFFVLFFLSRRHGLVSVFWANFSPGQSSGQRRKFAARLHEFGYGNGNGEQICK